MKLKSLLPFDNYTLTTRLKEEEVKARLAANIGGSPSRPAISFGPWGKMPEGKPYQGTLAGNHFEITRVIDYKNSFNPIITGDISSFLGTTEIKIKMQMHTFVIAFCIFWLTIVSIACIVMLTSGTINFVLLLQSGFGFPMLIPFFMLIFGIVLFTVPYRIESKKSRAFLRELLEGDENN